MSLNIKFSYLAKNSKFSRSNSYFLILTPTFLRDGFLNSYFQNPSENSAPQSNSALHVVVTLVSKGRATALSIMWVSFVRRQAYFLEISVGETCADIGMWSGQQQGKGCCALQWMWKKSHLPQWLCRVWLPWTFSSEKCLYLSYLSTKTYVLGTH